jgi:hypothetical protein
MEVIWNEINPHKTLFTMALFVFLYKEDKQALCADHVCLSICDNNISERYGQTIFKNDIGERY